MHLRDIGDRSNADILGTSKLEYTQLVNFVKSITDEANDLEKIAKCYIKVGEKYNVRGDIAFCQAILETDYFRYGNGTAVTPDQHNFCGMGVLRKGMKGNSFATIKDGVTAHIQHLYCYACDKDLPKGEKLIDPRFKYVQRGSAPTWYMLGKKWSSSQVYGEKILNIYKRIK